MQDDVATGDTGSGGTVTEVVRGHARIDRRVLELVGQSQRLVHGVDQPPVVLLDAIRPVAVAKGVRNAPHAALGYGSSCSSRRTEPWRHGTLRCGAMFPRR